MTVLLDTHAFLWMIADDKRLSKRAREILTSADNDLLLSVASLWEMVFKSTAGKLRLQTDPAAFLAGMLCGRLDFQTCIAIPLIVSWAHSRRSSGFPSSLHTRSSASTPSKPFGS